MKRKETRKRVTQPREGDALSGTARREARITAAKQALVEFEGLPDCARVRPRIAAKLLAVSNATFWRRVQAGELSVVRIGSTSGVTAGSLRRLLADGALR